MSKQILVLQALTVTPTITHTVCTACITYVPLIQTAYPSCILPVGPYGAEHWASPKGVCTMTFAVSLSPSRRKAWSRPPVFSCLYLFTCKSQYHAHRQEMRSPWSYLLDPTYRIICNCWKHLEDLLSLEDLQTNFRISQVLITFI